MIKYLIFICSLSSATVFGQEFLFIAADMPLGTYTSFIVSQTSLKMSLGTKFTGETALHSVILKLGDVNSSDIPAIEQGISNALTNQDHAFLNWTVANGRIRKNNSAVYAIQVPQTMLNVRTNLEKELKNYITRRIRPWKAHVVIGNVSNNYDKTKAADFFSQNKLTHSFSVNTVTLYRIAGGRLEVVKSWTIGKDTSNPQKNTNNPKGGTSAIQQPNNQAPIVPPTHLAGNQLGANQQQGPQNPAPLQTPVIQGSTFNMSPLLIIGGSLVGLVGAYAIYKQAAKKTTTR